MTFRYTRTPRGRVLHMTLDARTTLCGRDVGGSRLTIFDQTAPDVLLAPTCDRCRANKPQTTVTFEVSRSGVYDGTSDIVIGTVEVGEGFWATTESEALFHAQTLLLHYVISEINFQATIARNGGWRGPMSARHAGLFDDVVATAALLPAICALDPSTSNRDTSGTLSRSSVATPNGLRFSITRVERQFAEREVLRNGR